jgi:ureidoglycolate lyase
MSATRVGLDMSATPAGLDMSATPAGLDMGPIPRLDPPPRGVTFRELSVEPATPAALAPYGALVGADPSRPPRKGSFYGERVELWTPGSLVNDADATLSVARIHPRPAEVIWMERHFKHTQTFIPLGGAPFIMVLGAPTALPQPDPATVRAFRFDGSSGIMLHIGTWHEFPFAAAGTADVVVLLRRETMSNLEVRENDEAVGGDLEKRNLQARLGFAFSFTEARAP